MRALCLSLLIWPAVVFCWTFITVEMSVSLDGRAYLRRIKTEGELHYYLIIPDDPEFQVHPVTGVIIYPLDIELTSSIYGLLILPIIQPVENEPEINFIFSESDPFGLAGSRSN